MQKARRKNHCIPSLGNIQTFHATMFLSNTRLAAHNALMVSAWYRNVGQKPLLLSTLRVLVSTLMKLLVLDLYRPQEGKILYNNLDETEIHFDDPAETRSVLLPGIPTCSVAPYVKTLMFVNPAATEADLNDVLAKASCTNLLMRAEKAWTPWSAKVVWNYPAVKNNACQS